MTEITAKDFINILKKEGIDADNLQNMVVEALAEKGKKAATAESCTGGLLSKRITEVSGSSAVFECVVCSYANRIKNKVLGVKNETLNTVGAVSFETASQMANGVMKLSDADFGVSTTGIAGPAGGSVEKPVGLVYISVCDSNSTNTIKAMLWDAENPEREVIRKLASDIALYFLLRKIVK